jgi:hypothetical protein
MEHSPSVELNREEAMTLIQIANMGDVGSDNVDEDTVTRLQSLGLVEQRGISLALTLRGVQSVVMGAAASQPDPGVYYLPCAPGAVLRRLARPSVPAACLSLPEERPIRAQPPGRWSPLTLPSQAGPAIASPLRR